MKLTIENKHKVLGKIVKHDIVMLLPEMIHKGETYQFKGIDDRKRLYSWELTRYQMFNGYELRFSDGLKNTKQIVEKQEIDNVAKFLYICSQIISY